MKVKEAPQLRVNEGDRVYLRSDPEKAEGLVIAVLHGRYFVTWDVGRTWIYPAVDLEVL